MTVVVVVLVVVACAAAAATAAGLLLVRDPLDRLHYAGVSAVLGTVALGAAAVAHAGPGEVAVKVLAVTLVLLVSGPVLTHATGRAVVTRRRGQPADPDWEVTR